MITSIYVDGFKSLKGFNLDIKRGLNILVGPNGSGKTNIISFFEFLSNSFQYDIHEAVSHMGGAGSIFTKRAENEFNHFIHAVISGKSIIDRNRHITYEYSFILKVSIDTGYIFYEKQELKVLIDKSNLIGQEKDHNKQIWDLKISNESTELNKNDLVLSVLNRRKIKSRYGSKIDLQDLIDDLNRFLTRAPGRSLLYIVSRELDPLWMIVRDIMGGEVFNIIPSKVKIVEDIAKQPGIKKDGTGLASTLYAIKNNRFYRNQRDYYFIHFRPSKLNPKVYKQIIDLTKLANDSISDITVENNTFDNQLLVKITIKGVKNENIVLPLSAMSDGTIKWITLITAILSSSQIFSIEEPENFLHPWMQSEIIKILRNSIEQNSTDKFALMSTHSETLLNNSDPAEIILVSMRNGVTTAKRVDDLKLLREEIANTGFGMGYYYMTGALGDD